MILLAECDQLNAEPSPSSSDNSVLLLVTVEHTCGDKKKLSNAVIGGIVGGAAFIVLITIIVGIIALKRGWFRCIFKSEDKRASFLA